MNRGAFFSVRDSQQIDKYKGLNTYQLYLSDVDRVGYVGGDANAGIHAKFDLHIPDNHSGHIKNAMVRLKFVGMPLTVVGQASYGFGYVKSNFVRNCYSSKLGFTNQILGAFGIDEVCVVEDVEVPALQTTYVRMSAAGVFDEALGNENRGAVSLSDDSTPAIDRTRMAGLPNITRAAYDMPIKSLPAAKIGKPLTDDNWVLCDNPFGKTLRFELVAEDMITQLPLGHDADEATVICLEVRLLPDNQSNDKFSY